MRSAFSRKLACASLVAAAMLLATAQAAYATHFRYGTITYSQNPTNSRIITFTITTSWRRSFFTSNFGITPNVGTVINSSITGYDFNFGDGTTGAMSFLVTSVEPTNDWFTATTTLTRTYASNGVFIPYFFNCCRLSNYSASNPNGLQENGDTSWYVWTKVNTGVFNHPPTASVPPIITLAAGFADANFQIVATDIDEDALTYRLATQAEMCGPVALGPTCSSSVTGAVTQPPGLTVDANGIVHFDTRAPRAAGQTWNAQIVISDATTSTVVDFLIKLVNQTSQPPTTQINGSNGPYAIAVLPGTAVTFTATGVDPDAGATVTLSASGVPAGATFNPILPSTGAAPRSTVFSWTPQLANAGLSYNFNIITTDNTGLTDFNSASIQVLANLKPVVGCPAASRTVRIDPLTGLAGVSVSLSIDDEDEDDVTAMWQLLGPPFTVYDTETAPDADGVTLTLEHEFPVGTFATEFVVTDGVTPAVRCPLLLSVERAEQTITFDNIPDQVYSGAPLTLTASATSNLPVSFAVISGPASVSGDQLSITGIGTITIEASQGGDATYAPALSVLQDFVVTEATPIISVAGGTFDYDGLAHPATASVFGVGGGALPFTVTYDGAVDAPIHGGTYAVVVSFAGDAFHHPHSATATIEITRVDPQITLTGGGTFTYDANFHGATATVTGVLGEELHPVFMTYNGSGVTPGYAGSYDALASYPGNRNYNPVTATATIIINKADPIITITGGGTFTFDNNYHPATATAVGVSGEDLTGTNPLTITYNGTMITPGIAGNYLIVASIGESTNYNAGSASVTLVINKADPVMTVIGGSFTYDGIAHGATVSATGPLAEVLGPITVTYNGSASAPINAGTYTVLASFAGNDNYNAATATGVIDIAKATPVIGASGGTFDYDGLPHPATASATGVGGASLGPIVITYDGSPSAPIAGGTYAVLASYAGDSNYNGGSATSTIAIDAIPLVVTADDKSKIAGEPNPVLTATFAGLVTGDAFSPVLTTTATTSSPVGAYPITVTPFSSPNYSITFVDGTLTVNPARQLCLDYDASRAHNSGSTIPVRLRLCDMNGNNISSSSFVLTAHNISLAGGGSAAAADAGNANPGAIFRQQSGGYMFNLQTTGLPSGAHTLQVGVSGDPTTYSVPVVIR